MIEMTDGFAVVALMGMCFWWGHYRGRRAAGMRKIHFIKDAPLTDQQCFLLTQWAMQDEDPDAPAGEEHLLGYGPRKEFDNG